MLKLNVIKKVGKKQIVIFSVKYFRFLKSTMKVKEVGGGEKNDSEKDECIQRVRNETGREYGTEFNEVLNTCPTHNILYRSKYHPSLR